MIEDPAKVDGHFNLHFCAVGAELDSKIPRSNKSLSYMEQSSITSFYNGTTSDFKVELIIG